MVEFKGGEADHFDNDLANAHTSLLFQMFATVRYMDLQKSSELENYYRELPAFRDLESNQNHSKHTRGLGKDFERIIMFAKVLTDRIETKIRKFRDTYGNEAMVATNNKWTSTLVSPGVHNNQLKMVPDWLGENNSRLRNETTFQLLLETHKRIVIAMLTANKSSEPTDEKRVTFAIEAEFIFRAVQVFLKFKGIDLPTVQAFHDAVGFDDGRAQQDIQDHVFEKKSHVPI